MYSTGNNLPEGARAGMIKILNLGLADAIALQTQAKQAHWNVKGPQFVGLHQLFDAVSDAMLRYADLIAERTVQLGGIAEGTAKMAVQWARIKPYPLDISAGPDHCRALSQALTVFGEGLRRGITTAEEAGDSGTSDLYTELSRGTDKLLWMVEAHLQADA